eukprot:CAMPEP_0119292160 /NCGR_PEP_ID=MMETSP1329-20130426/43657_1 /TAXON_ID=114041 /ORGANISM="Genus nov. species nov., Strain RCC1024" /LENGTH=146 /DNA_ID=CAMNT_0007292995 /DNA_START=127 /DNA_END=567 /DNA_ORIENTATION=+
MFTIAAVAKAATTCNSTRPNSAGSHRSFFAPAPLKGGLDVATWTEKLCCVYTHVEWVEGTGVTVLETYDGDQFFYYADFAKQHPFGALAASALSDICAMPMGSAECAEQAACLEPPTAAPSDGGASDAAPRGRRPALALLLLASML